MKEVYPLYLDERAYTVLKTIVNNPSITGKEVEMSLQLSRKQLSYTIEKINDYLQDNGTPKIEGLELENSLYQWLLLNNIRQKRSQGMEQRIFIRTRNADF